MSPLATVPPTREKRPEYRDGGRKWPSVTTILGALDSPGLDRWRVKQALNGIDPYADRGAADAGTLCHAAIAWTLDPEHFKAPDTRGYPEMVIAEAVAAHRCFKLWLEAHEVRPILIEHVMVNKALGYGGTLDLFAEIDGRPEVLDFKTSKAIYADYFIQAAAYAQLLAACTEYQAQALRIVRLDKSIVADPYTMVWKPNPGDPPYEQRALETDGSPCVSRRHFAVFEAARLAYETKRAWERKGGDPSEPV